MTGEDFRFWAPETAEERLALARARVRERRDGVKVMATVFGGAAAGSAVVGLGIRLGVGAAERMLVPMLILDSVSGIALVIVMASALIWGARLRQLTRHDQPRDSALPPTIEQQYEEAVQWRRVCLALMACFGGAGAVVFLLGEPNHGPLVLLLGCWVTSLMGAIWYAVSASELRGGVRARERPSRRTARVARAKFLGGSALRH